MSTDALARIKAKLAALETAEVSLTPTPLWVYLYLYYQSYPQCYTNYMEGAKALYDWLKPIKLPLSLPVNKRLFYLRRYNDTYELGQLARIICDYDSHYDVTKLARTEDIVLNCFLMQVAPRIHANNILHK